MSPKYKRKAPITGNSSRTSRTPKATRAIINKFHTLRKQEALATTKNDRCALNDIKKQMEELGGVKAYQEMSHIGQGKDRGGGSEKILINWLPQYLPPHLGKGKEKVSLLEVGALRPDNYESCSSWISNTAIDLCSRHPKILEQDFLLLDPLENRGKWDVISLSLVLNFVPNAHDRGKMLRLARTFLKSPAGLMFIVLPSACVQNSRYMDRARLELLLRATGFRVITERCKTSGKMIYFLCQADAPSEPDGKSLPKELTAKRTLREGDRNNFAILL